MMEKSPSPAEKGVGAVILSFPSNMYAAFGVPSRSVASIEKSVVESLPEATLTQFHAAWAIEPSEVLLRLNDWPFLHKKLPMMLAPSRLLQFVEPSIDEARAMGPTLMDPTRIVNVVMQTSSAARAAFAEEQLGSQLELLRAAATLKVEEAS